MFTGSLGGPIKRDKMWFLVTARHQSSDEIITDVPVQIIAPDGEVINSYLDTYVRGPSLRLTWQAAQKHKLASFVQRWWKRKGKDFGAGQDPRASQFRDPKHAHHTVGNVRWTSPMTSRILLEAGYSWTLVRLAGRADAGRRKPRGTRSGYVKTRKTDTQRQVDDECAFTAANSAQPGCTTWGSNQIQRQDNTRHVFQAVMSYVTGSHSFKFGYNHEIGPDGRMGNDAQRRSLPELHRRPAELGDCVEHAARSARHRRLRRGDIRAGYLDDQAADHQPWHAHRMV